MSKIRLEIPNNAPGCFLIREVDTGKSILVQTDWDFPGTASTFGWSVAEVIPEKPDGFDAWLDGGAWFDKKEVAAFKRFEKRWFPNEGEAPFCEHSGTDGTIKCPGCKMAPGVFISAAAQWMRENEGAEADNPGYEFKDA